MVIKSVKNQADTMYKNGEKIVCINNDVWWISCEVHKIYTIKILHGYTIIEDDNRTPCIPNWNDFISLKEYRKNKLKNLQKL